MQHHAPIVAGNPWWRRLLRMALPAVVAAVLVTGIAGGLWRAGVAVPLPAGADWPGRAVFAHAFLMMVAFMGTVIGIERAVASKQRWPWLAPAQSAAAGVAMLAGATATAMGLAVTAALVFVAVNVHLVARQRAAHTAVLLGGALAWLVGNGLLAWGSPVAAATPWWFAFLIFTIAAERLEMTRLMRRRRGAAGALFTSLAALLAGALAGTVVPVWGGVLYGLALLALAAWLLTFDIARRTVRTDGLSRYMAVCLLTGYAWLAVAGVAWALAALGRAPRDLALHALGLGFVFSMMFGHAPVILPALARVKVLFGWPFYLPFALLHMSLALRVAAGPFDVGWLARGALGNALAIGLFAATMAGGALAWRARHGSAGAGRPRPRAADAPLGR